MWHLVISQGGPIGMGKHENKIIGDAQGGYDPAWTKDVQEVGGGRHSSEDIGNADDQGHEDDEDDGKE
ncbi:MAG: hypothetical protein WBF75_05645 [Pseudonocardiaceae bacterium]